MTKNVTFPVATTNITSQRLSQLQLSKAALKSKVNSIAATLERRGFKISRTVITAEVMNLYPLATDWEISPRDCKGDIIRALLRKRS